MLLTPKPWFLDPFLVVTGRPFLSKVGTTLHAVSYTHLHNNGGSECSENDIKYVKDFYQRIMQQKDPFSIIYQRQNEIKKRTVKQSEIKPNPYINNRKTTNKNRGYTRLRCV